MQSVNFDQYWQGEAIFFSSCNWELHWNDKLLLAWKMESEDNGQLFRMIWGEPDFFIPAVFRISEQIDVWVIHRYGETFLVMVNSTETDVKLVVPLRGYNKTLAKEYCKKCFPPQRQRKFLRWLLDEVKAINADRQS